MEDADDLDVFEEDAWEDDDAACRSKPRPPAIRGGLFGLLSVAEQTTREKRIIL